MNRRFGVELEISGISREKALKALKAVGVKVEEETYNHQTKPHWKIVPDSSIQDGFEVVSPILHGEAGLEKVEIVARALEDAGATANKSCGFHVHFDIAGIKLGAIKTIIRRYAKFEDDIDAFMPSSRRDNANKYCLSMKKIMGVNFEEAGSIERIAAIQGSRYYKVNLESYHRHGTIEFRHHSGTSNAAKICGWIRFLAEFMDVCEKMEVGEQIQPASQLQPANRKFLEALSGKNPVSLDYVCEKLGWLNHTARSALSRLRKAGYAIKSVKTNGKTLYIYEGKSEEDSLWAGISQKLALFYQRRAAVLAVAV
ncbi:MAG: amidoligase family protein [Desulfovibrio sp.]|nr:amidoligase family protein [Desulfovibrio sp.]